MLYEPFTGVAEGIQGVAGYHGTAGRHDLGAFLVLPMVFCQGIQPEHLPRQPPGFQKGMDGGFPVHGLGIGEDEQGRRIVQGSGL